MIMKFILAFLLGLTCTIGISQSHIADSLRNLLVTTTKPIDRFDLINNLVLDLTSWKGDNVDSALSMQMLQIAQRQNNDSLLAISYNWLGTYFYLNKGDNSSALEYYFKAIPLAEKAKDKRRISSLYFDISLVYFDIQNNQEALENTKKGRQNLPQKDHPLYNFMLIQYEGSMAQYFLLENQLDSAFYYVQRMSETILKINGGHSYDFLEFTLKGSLYALLNNQKLADENYRKALELSYFVESTYSTLLFYVNYIPFLLSNDRIDEATTQARRLLQLGEQYDNNNLKMAGSRYLRQVFERSHKIDSAYYYSQMEAKINTLIFSQNNINRVQALAFSNQLRTIEEKAKEEAYQNKLKFYGLLTGLGIFSIIAFILYGNNRQKQKANRVLEVTLSNLKSTQSQLVQSEKMASLGELTAGIAHEIQNPLNFVNNFSEVNSELIDELQQEADNGNLEEVKAIAKDIKENEERINHHGKRADAIVKGMLQHSRTSTGEKETTDINALADEYLRLAYHGLRAKDKTFNATLKTEYDENIGSINIIPQDIGRVILNLITNAFYAVSAKASAKEESGYEPTVSVSTQRMDGSILITVKDNGNGIPEGIKEKIFQPFFTTKPTGDGTGLGLSLSYDIVTKGHGGTLEVRSVKGEGAEFIVKLP
ncbi:MAG: two-component system NtrC family sensor kinase [Cyclobacteriaceae bacterium]|jgi:two-component system NtrC family sensor kinase